MRESIQKCHHPGKRGRARSRFAKVLVKAERYAALKEALEAADKLAVTGSTWVRNQTLGNGFQVAVKLDAYAAARAKVKL